ncbi:DEAD/DEAH box helicase [Sphingobacterium sp. SGG-5]|uniref:DEAD/DEAH box helicase n=1 Tax=Sphingobacterium sp. SGG-5 TaxID=2710881 RepID=UPI0013EA8316|nr:DEAD/DEAH box helicase [Sphingobacterium sp. SGG-5]NGM61477.1 DEAD/DEAH box helicase [Sphingobacterium sp. SGG-5]
MTIQPILARLQIEQLNDMQQAVITSFQPENDFILLSPTGSGKTLAFALLIEQLLDENETKGIQALIVIPTRELALQIESVVRQVSKGRKIVCCYGGNDSRSEKKSLAGIPDILIGTPGRIIYHIEKKHLQTTGIHTLVLDEYDKCLELGFQEQLELITNAMPQVDRKILTSATKLAEIPAYFSLNTPVTVDFLDNRTGQPDIAFKKVICPAQHKLKTLFKLVCSLESKKILIFCNHREAVDHISELLDDRGLIHDIFHGGLEQRDRELSLLKFRNDSNRILITTDLAARGLDIPEVNTIIHYQLPAKEESFVHRNGRTARMNKSGEVIVLLKPDDNFPYLPENTAEIILEEEYALPPNTPFSTLYIPVGRKNKVNKVDIVGYLLRSGDINKDDIGLIEVKDKEAYIAVRREVASKIIKTYSDGKIKGNKIKFYRT